MDDKTLLDAEHTMLSHASLSDYRSPPFHRDLRQAHKKDHSRQSFAFSGHYIVYLRKCTTELQ